MKGLVVFDHPRRHSFCGAVLDELIAGLAEAGHEVDIADRQAQLREVRALGRSLVVQPA